MMSSITQVGLTYLYLYARTNTMELSWIPYTLEFKHPFRIAHGVRSSTPLMLTRIIHEGFTGYGEASMPPYLGENQETAEMFYSKVNFDKFSGPEDLENIIPWIDSLAPGNTAAKASVDIALHDLLGKMKGLPLYMYYGADRTKAPCTSYTIGMDCPEGIRDRIHETGDFPILKVKLGGKNDLRILETVHACTHKVFSVDVNQGWEDREFALDMIHRMKEMRVMFVEQPFEKSRFEDHAWLKERSPLPIIADESCQRLSDVEKCSHSFHGINIKLMKCTGLFEARMMIQRAKSLEMKILMGCMSETSCAISAAAQLSPFADWCDLDGPLLIKNNAFDGITFQSGKVILSEMPGIGAVPKEKVFE
jgi:L-alanine-DL-glutamate epimerase-like enolase superfamily enzyme